MRTRILAVAMTACIPVALVAQRGGGGGGGASSAPPAASGGTQAAGAKTPSSRDFAEMNPASLLVDKKKKVSLADSTVAQLKAIAKKIDERNKPFYASYDSVRKWTMPLSSGAAASARPGFSPGDNNLSASSTSEGEAAKMRSSMRDLRNMMTELKTRREADVADALGAVPDAQKDAAKALLGQQTDELGKLIGGRP